MTTIALKHPISDCDYEITDFPEEEKTYLFFEDILRISHLLHDLNQCIFNNHQLRDGAWDLLNIHDVFRYSDTQLIEHFAHEIYTNRLYIHEKTGYVYQYPRPLPQAADDSDTQDAAGDPAPPPAKTSEKELKTIDIKYIDAHNTPITDTLFTVESTGDDNAPDGRFSASGTTDSNGVGHIDGVPTDISSIQYILKNDPAPYAPEPEFKPSATPDAEASKTPFDKIIDWILGTAKGDFNKDQSTSQIAVNTILGVIPVVDQVLDIRDISAIISDIIYFYAGGPPEQNNDDTDTEMIMWLNVFIIVIGCIPSAGSVAKGVIRIILKHLDDALSPVSKALSPQKAKKLWEELLGVLNYFGKGNAHQWLKQIPDNLNTWMDDAAIRITHGLDAVQDILDKALIHADSMFAKALIDSDTLSGVTRQLTKAQGALSTAYNRLDAMKTRINTLLEDKINQALGAKHHFAMTGKTGTQGSPVMNTRKQNMTPPPKDNVSYTRPKTPAQEDALRNANNNKAMEKGEPVNAVTGAVVGTVTDFTLAGRIPLIWERHYNSQNADTGHLGKGWQCPADTRLILKKQGTVICDFGTKSAAVFSRKPEGKEILPDLRQNYFLSQNDTHYKVTDRSNITRHFPKTDNQAHSYLERITDAHNNFLIFSRTPDGLSEITDNTGLCIKVYSQNQRICSMTRILPDTRKIRLAEYHYHPKTHDLITAWDMSDQPQTYAYRNHCMVRHTLKTNFSFYYEYDTLSSKGRCIHTWGDNGLYDYRFDYNTVERATKITNSLGYTETIHYSPEFKPVAVIDHENHETRYTYDTSGRPLSVTDPLQRTTTYEYDSNGNLTRITRPDNTCIHITCDPKGNPVTIIDPNGRPWHQEFDDHSRLIRKTTPTGAHTRYTYNEHGDPASITTPNGGTTTFSYNASGDIIAVTHADNTMERFERDMSGNITAAVDPLDRKTRYIYDDAFNLTRIIKPSGHAVHCTYNADNQLTSYTDEAGHRTRFVYTGTGQLQKRINPDSTEITYHYDTEEQLTRLTNERGEHHIFKRDPSGRVFSETDFWGNESQYQYDPTGQLIRYTDPLTRFIVYTTDTLGRLTYKHMSDGTHEAFDYDPNGNLIAFKNNTNITHREFDPENRLIRETVQSPHTRHTTAFSYDAMGNRTQRISPFGNTIHYEYDILSRNTAIRINDDTVDITRNNLGLPIRESFENKLSRSYTYTPDNQPATQEVTLGSGKTINRSYEYDLSGNLTARMDTDKGKQYFTYNPMGRITQYIDPEQNISQFFHDPAGDLLHKGPRQHTGFRHMTHEGADYWFNMAGNLVTRKTSHSRHTFYWDVNNTLKEVRNQETNQITYLTYDALGRRTTKTTGTHTTTFTWDGDHLLSDNPDATGAREFVYYPGTFEPFAIIDKNHNIHYVHNDSVGLPQEITDTSGNIVWSARYDAQGTIETIYIDDFDNPLRFQGQYYDPEFDLSYNRFRYFDSRIGSFVSQDPLGPAAGTNVYAYAPNVWGWLDPLGLCKEASNNIANTIPERMARVVPAEYSNGSRLAAPNATEAWVTAADDLSGINTSQGLAQRLTLVDDAGNVIPGPRAVIEFDAPASGIASPVNRSISGFVGGGKTAGGAREFVIPNTEINQLQNVTTRIIK